MGATPEATAFLDRVAKACFGPSADVWISYWPGGTPQEWFETRLAIFVDAVAIGLSGEEKDEERWDRERKGIVRFAEAAIDELEDSKGDVSTEREDDGEEEDSLFDFLDDEIPHAPQLVSLFPRDAASTAPREADGASAPGMLPVEEVWRAEQLRPLIGPPAAQRPTVFGRVMVEAGRQSALEKLATLQAAIQMGDEDACDVAFAGLVDALDHELFPAILVELGREEKARTSADMASQLDVLGVAYMAKYWARFVELGDRLEGRAQLNEEQLAAARRDRRTLSQVFPRLVRSSALYAHDLMAHPPSR